MREYAERFDGISVACLVAADRYQHLRDEIVPQLEKGKIVITDRYVLSSLILQRMDEVSEEFILALNNEIVQPDLQVAVFADRDVIQNRPLFRETYHSVTSRFFSNNTCWKLILAIHFISPIRLNKILFFYCIIMHYPV